MQLFRTEHDLFSVTSQPRVFQYSSARTCSIRSTLTNVPCSFLITRPHKLEQGKKDLVYVSLHLLHICSVYENATL